MKTELRSEQAEGGGVCVGVLGEVGSEVMLSVSVSAMLLKVILGRGSRSNGAG